MPVMIDELALGTPSFEPPAAEGEWLPTGPWGQEPWPQDAGARRGAPRPANMWAAELDGYAATEEEKRAWQSEALDLPDLLPLGGGIISPYDGQY